MSLLADSAAQFCAREHGEGRLRASRDRTPCFDRSVWKKAAELGWLGILVPEADGGMGLGFSDLADVLVPWGAACAPEPLVGAGVLAGRALVHGDGPARGPLLERLVAGELIPALVWNEEGRFAVPADADGWLVRTKDGLVWVENGVAVERERRADGSFAAKLVFEKDKLTGKNLVATADRSAAVIERALDEARIALSLEMAGMMRRMLDITLEYLRTRVQFGKPIGSFQALQHRAVDLYIACELASDVAREAARAADEGKDIRMFAARAKARAAESLGKIAREAVQLHGAIGFTDEYRLGLYVNRALVCCAWLGNAAEMRRRYAALAPAYQSEMA